LQSSAKQGITWISQGAWRDNWWNKSDNQYDFQTQYLQEEAGVPDPEHEHPKTRISQAFKALKIGWDNYNSTDELRKLELQAEYITELGQNYDGPEDAVIDLLPSGKQNYHVSHHAYHQDYARLKASREYQGIYFFDMSGNLIYSVDKEPRTDGEGSTLGATPFGENYDLVASGPYKDTGLGKAFQEGKDGPDKYHYVDFPSEIEMAKEGEGAKNAKKCGILFHRHL
jgi:hypothetical protein